MANIRYHRVKRVIVKSKGRKNRHCRFGTGCIHGFSFCSIIVAIVFIVALFLLLLFFFLQPCSSDLDCAVDNPCSIDYCRSNFCRHEYIKDCCNVDNDCDKTQCYNSFCNKNTNKCTVTATQNGTDCSDHNQCTANDKCHNGECLGNTLNCDFNQCANGQCYKTRGCVYTNKIDDTPCDDNDKCTQGDKCWNGLCTSGIPKDCSHLSDECNTGMCNSADGQCILVPKTDGVSCTKTLKTCEEANPVCKSGQCTAEPKTCFDNNPCTVDACVETVGCMIQYNFSSGTCLPGCREDSHCPTSYICHDGTCIDIPPDLDVNVRFIDYEIQNCTNSSGHRLLMSFVMDAGKDVVVSDTYFRVIKEAGDITTATTQPLGFIDEVLNLDSNQISNDTSRSAFTLTTACQSVTSTNCNSIFAGRSYEFDLKLTHCKSINTEPFQNCIDPNIHVQANVEVSISDCGNFNEQQILYTYGSGVLYHNGTKYVGMNPTNKIDIRFSTGEDTRVYAGIETNVYHNTQLVANLYSVRFCSPNNLHHLSKCVTGQQGSSYCPYTGCFGWESTYDSPLKHHVDLMQTGFITALAKSNMYNSYGCYLDGVYYGSDILKCEQNPMCPTAWWPHVMDDGISFTTEWIKTHPEYTSVEETLVVDMVYRITACTHTLRNVKEELHQISTIKLLK